ncbi:MAG: hypothetical protein H6Q68_3020 [Firmicutes bacterium]|nr:hypothetical protein [Bacillota bacterium]
MRKVICILLIVCALVWPSNVLAAGFTLNIQVMRQDDGTTCSELWYNDKVVWRLALLADGAKPVSGSYNAMTTLIAPDIIDGLFLIKVQ